MDQKIRKEKHTLFHCCFVLDAAKTSEGITKDLILSGMGKGQQRKCRRREIKETWKQWNKLVHTLGAEHWCPRTQVRTQKKKTCTDFLCVCVIFIYLSSCFIYMYYFIFCSFSSLKTSGRDKLTKIRIVCASWLPKPSWFPWLVALT